MSEQARLDVASPPPTVPTSGPDRPADDAVGHRDIGRTTGKAVRAGMAWTLGGQWAGYAVQILTTAILARLVSPHDFGIVGEALTVTAFASQLQSLGLSQAVIQRAKLTHGQMSNLFWVNVAAGAALMLLVMAVSPFVASFYGDSALVGVTIAMSLNFFVTGFAVQHAALMSRRMEFRSIAVRNLLPRVIAGALAILVAAVFDLGYWALVVQQFATAVCITVFVWTAIDWRPGRLRRRTGVRPLLRFGAGVSVANIFYYFSSNADNILVGRFLGTAELGLYARAYNLFLVPLRQLHAPLGNVVQPVMSAIVHDPDRYRQFYRRMLSAITLVGMPSVVGLAVLSRPFIEVLLGHRWLGAAEPFRWLAVAGFLQMAARTFSWLYTTAGRAKAMATWAMITSPLLVLAFAVGVHWGITGVAEAYAISQAALILPAIWWATRDTPVTMRDVSDAVWRSVVVAAVCGVVVFVVRVLLGSAAPAVTLVGAATAGLACWLAMLACWPHLRGDLKALTGRFSRRAQPAAETRLP
jgi:PST family polysaccharide transporter